MGGAAHPFRANAAFPIGMKIAASQRVSSPTHCIMTNSSCKHISKLHILAMARHAGLAFQDDNNFFLNDLASEKELVAFARLLERAVRASCEAPAEVA